MNQTTLRQRCTLEALYHQLNTDCELETLLGYPKYLIMTAELGVTLSEMGSEMIGSDALKRHQAVLQHPAARSFNAYEKAPISTKERDRLWQDVQDPAAAARRHGDGDLDAYDVDREKRAGTQHFELGCWLWYYQTRVGEVGELGVLHRIDCLRRIASAGIKNPGYQFYSVFRFGERHFDTIFEMGDAEQVIHALRPTAAAHPDEAFGLLFKYYDWPLSLKESAKAA